MALSRLVEFIQRLGIPKSGVNVHAVNVQSTPVPVVLTAVGTIGSTQKFALNARQAPFATIVYRIMFGAAIVPNVINAQIVQSGYFTFDPVISATVIRDGIDMFVVSTYANPLTIQVTNTSVLAQNYEHILSTFDITTPDDFRQVMHAIDSLDFIPKDSPVLALEKVGAR